MERFEALNRLLLFVRLEIEVGVFVVHPLPVTIGANCSIVFWIVFWIFFRKQLPIVFWIVPRDNRRQLFTGELTAELNTFNKKWMDDDFTDFNFEAYKKQLMVAGVIAEVSWGAQVAHSSSLTESLACVLDNIFS